MPLDVGPLPAPRLKVRPLKAATPRVGAFTLVELIAVLAILVLLALLTFPNVRNYLVRAGEVRCAGNMRSIAVTLHSYLPDHAMVWPQGPAPEAGAAWENFWITTLQPYGIGASTWACPTTSSDRNSEGTRVHYAPTLFPATPNIANRWATHPWLIERSEGHGNGALICFPDGSVKSFDKVLAELGVR
jgi:type II secretory pathway pseudopilin PulG